MTLASSTAVTWDLATQGYDAHRRHDPVYNECVHAAASAARVQPGQFTLDCGCGTGLVTLGLVAQGATVVALDYSHGSLVELKGKPGTNGVMAVQADIRRLPFRFGTFARVVCANTLQHLAPGSPQQEAAKELRRVAANDGRLVVTAHHFSRAKRKAGWIKEGKPGQASVDYIFRFERGELASLFPGAEIRSIGFARRPQRWLGRLFGCLASRLNLGHMLMAVSTAGQVRSSHDTTNAAPRPA